MKVMRKDDFAWLNVPAEVAARRLLGCELVREIGGREIRVRIVETEAYDQGDEASHTFNGRTGRNDAMSIICDGYSAKCASTCVSPFLYR